MKTYEAIFNQEKNKGVFAISLVNAPAMEESFIALSKEKEPIKFAEVDKEQQILLGLVLEPNKKVYRNQGGEEFEMFFSADTIKELSHNFFRSGFHTNSTIEHSKDSQLEGVTFVESWLVENPKVDKSVNFGFEYPKGSWIVSMKIDDPKIWKEYIKSGEVLGFSIDALVDLKEVNNKSEIKMSTETVENNKVVDAIVALGENIKSLFVKDATEEPVKVELGSVKSGDLVIMFDGDAMAVGQPVWVEAEEGVKTPLPVGEYDIEGDRKLIVVEEGLVGELQEGAAEAVPTEEPAVLTDAPEVAAPVGEAEAAVNAIKSLLIKYGEEADKRAEENNKVLLSKIEALEGQVTEFGTQPKAKKIVSSPTEFSDMTNYQKMQYRKENGK